MPILIDFNQKVIACAAQVFKHVDNPSEYHIKHCVLGSLADYRMKFGKEFGEIIICADSNNYWRKDIFPYYKAKRAKARDKSPIDWNITGPAMDNIRSDIDEFFPYKVVRCPKTEADDIIGVLVHYFQKNELIKKGLIEEPQPIMIISTDKDFKQLQIYRGVSQFSPMTKKKLVEPDPIRYLREHIIRGDTGDGIPNIYSDDDCLVHPDKRQPPVKAKTIEPWLNSSDPTTYGLTEEALRNWHRNKKLVDMIDPSMVPVEIQDAILTTYKDASTGKRSQLPKYFAKNKLNILYDRIEQF